MFALPSAKENITPGVLMDRCICWPLSLRAHTFACSLPFGHAAVAFLNLAGPRLGNSPVPSIVQCLARKDGTDDFYQLKVSSFFMSLLKEKHQNQTAMNTEP